MKILDVDVSVTRRGQLMRIASSLGVDNYPIGEGKEECTSWIDSVIGMIEVDERYRLSANEALIVFHHLGVDKKGIGYICGLFGIDVN